MCPPGGPLCEGDIEEAGGVLQVFCPWHDYDFDLRTGKSGTLLQVSDENAFLFHNHVISLSSCHTFLLQRYLTCMIQFDVFDLGKPSHRTS